MKIIYVHHALRDTGNPPSQDDNIKPLGRQDAEVVSKLLQNARERGQNIKAIYTSDYYRCAETSGIINQIIEVPIYKEPRLNEFDSKNESWVNLQTRVRNAIFDIVCNYADTDAVICVTSGVNVVSFLQLAFGLQVSEDAPYIGVPSCSPLFFEITKENFNRE